MPQKLTTSQNEVRSSDGDEPTDTSNESDALVTKSIQSEGPASGGVPHVHLGGASWHADDVNGSRNRTDASKSQMEMSEGQADESRGSTDTWNTSNSTEMAVVSCRDGAETYLRVRDAKRDVDEMDGIGSYTDMSTGHRDALSVETDAPNASNHAGTTGISHGDEPNTYLGAGGAKCGVDATDGIESHTDASSGHGDAQSVQTDAITTVNTPGIVSIHPIEPEMPNLPGEGARWTPDQPNGAGNLTDRSSAQTDAPSVQTDALMLANALETIKICPLKLKTPNSPPGSARKRAEHPNGLRNCADTTSGPTDVQSVAHETETAANASKTVSTRPNIPKPPNSPSGDVKRDVDEPNGCRDHTDASSAQMDAPSIQTGAATPANRTERVRTRRHGSKTQDSPHGREIATPKHTYQWKRVSVGDGDVYLPQNMPIDRTGRIFVFGQAESAGEAVVAWRWQWRSKWR